MKEKCISDIEDFLNTSFFNNDKYNNILYGELKQSLIQTKNFLFKNLDNREYLSTASGTCMHKDNLLFLPGNKW